MLGSFSALGAAFVEACGSEVLADSLGPALPFHPLKLLLLVGWVYLCMYCVQQVQFGPLVPEKYKTVANLVSLFAGPILLLSLVVAETVRKSRSGQSRFFDLLKQQLGNALTGLRSMHAAAPEEEAAFRLLDSSGRTIDEVCGHGQGKQADAHILEQTESIVADALERRASDILIDPQDASTYNIRLRIDGVLRNTQQLDAATCQAVINSIKAVAAMDISERRRPQDGAFTARRGEQAASFRVASSGTVNGEKLSIRVLNRDAAGYMLKDLGLSAKQNNIIRKALHTPSGMILICGPTGSGKTTTMYAMLNSIDRLTRNVITVEDPIEAMLPQTSQIEINPKAEITFANTLRSVLAKVISALGLISIWLVCGSIASIGSSTVITFRVRRSMLLSMAYMVVVLPLPVGPQIRIIPEGVCRALRMMLFCLALRPRSFSMYPAASRFRTRIESFSPLTVPLLATRNDAACSPRRAVNAPSCGRRRSEMSMAATALMLLITA